jgi:pullulanase/glycogen debranching enzyme
MSKQPKPPIAVKVGFDIGAIHQTYVALHHRMSAIAVDVANTDGEVRDKNRAAYDKVIAAIAAIHAALANASEGVKDAYNFQLTIEKHGPRNHHQQVTLSIPSAVAIEGALTGRLAQLHTQIAQSDTTSAKERASLFLLQTELAAVIEAKQAINAAYN